MSDDLDRNLVEVAHLLRELTEHPGWLVLQEIAEQQTRRETSYLLEGRAKTHDDYKSKAGWVSGALWVLAVPEAAQRELDADGQKRRAV